MKSENLTANESLDLITAMIRQAKGNAQRNHFYFLLWGWVIVVANLSVFILDKLDYSRPYVAWLITVPAWFFTFYKAFTSRHRQKMTTHFDRISGALWMSFGVSLFILVVFGNKINFQLNPIILVITAVPTLVSGIILNFRPLVAGAAIFWIGGVICFLVSKDMQPLIGALTIALGYLVPGYMLRQKGE